MKVIPKKFLMGGPILEETPETEVNEPTELAVEEGPLLELDPMSQLALIFMQGLQNQDCQLLSQGALIFLQIVQQMQGGAPEEPQGEPVFARNGAKLNIVRRIKK